MKLATWFLCLSCALVMIFGCKKDFNDNPASTEPFEGVRFLPPVNGDTIVLQAHYVSGEVDVVLRIDTSITGLVEISLPHGVETVFTRQRSRQNGSTSDWIESQRSPVISNNRFSVELWGLPPEDPDIICNDRTPEYWYEIRAVSGDHSSWISDALYIPFKIVVVDTVAS